VHTLEIPVKQSGKKARILLACKESVRGGGMEKHIIQIARYLSKDYQLSFLMTDGYVESDMPDLGRIYRFPGRGRLLFFPLDLCYLVYVLLRERIDILHAHQRYPAFLGSLVSPMLRRKLLVTVHNAFPDKAGFSLWGDHMIAVSHGVELWLIDSCHQDRERITVVHNGIAPPRSWAAAELDSLRDEFSIPRNSLVLFSVGRLSEQKNHASMLRILSKINCQDWIFLLAGEGEMRQELEDQAIQLGIENKVKFLGFRQDVDGLMQLADIFIMTSAWEGLPYVLVEAMASGLPAIVTNVGGVAEAVIDGDNGIVVDAGNEEIFTKKLELLIGNAQLRHDMSAAGKVRFREQFLDQAMFDSIEREYSRLLNV